MLSFLPQLDAPANIFGYAVPIGIIFAFPGVILNLLIIFSETKRLQLNRETTLMIYLIYFMAANIISRLLFIISRVYLHHDFAFQSKVFYFYTTQKISLGILLGLIVAVLIGVYAIDSRRNLMRYFDIFFLGYTATLFTRIGDALMHYHPGKITTQLWGVQYLNQYRHEPSLYEAFNLTLLLIVAWRLRKKIKKPGLLALIIIAWTSFSRFITDFFRNNDLPLQNTELVNAFHTQNFHLVSWLTLNQIIYFILFLVAAGVIWRIYKKDPRRLLGERFDILQPE